MSRKDAIETLFLKKTPASEKTPAEKTTQRVRTGAISAMGSSLQEMAEGAKAAARLQDQLAQGDAVVALDPSLIEGSSIADRLPTQVDPKFDELVASIAGEGQQVPILVRPHPDVTGKYQIAYGRRRLRAAIHLGRDVFAIVRSLTDRELVIAQGRENLDRADLSFIEKALFALHLEDAGHDRSTIIAALSTDKSDLSRYISVARDIPLAIAIQIGPAAKVGRSRWVALTEALQTSGSRELVERVVASDEFRVSDSDTRFGLVLKAVSKPAQEGKKREKTWNTPTGRKAAKIQQDGDKTALIFDEKRVPAFGEFVANQLDSLYSQFIEISQGDNVE
ncbi:plasmid partitioning protein RepB [Agrobacterium tumefaciens]|uniref:plasmid partitioning protein RepB n=1 Tax=Agrobacterium tumefaciens TaxID=358 RepID=UPI0009772325|nr:plasmid partitioning protein RepB [Agrobacterium tumefaciens]